MQSNCMKCLFEGTDDNEHAIALQFALDGVQTYKLGFNDVWPLICLNLNLPPSEQFQEDNVLPLAIIPGLKEPVNLDSFISPMVDEVLHLSQNSMQYYDTYANETFNLKVHIVICTGDTPAVTKLISMKKSTAKYCCRICKIKGRCNF